MGRGRGEDLRDMPVFHHGAAFPSRYRLRSLESDGPEVAKTEDLHLFRTTGQAAPEDGSIRQRLA